MPEVKPGEIESTASIKVIGVAVAETGVLSPSSNLYTPYSATT